MNKVAAIIVAGGSGKRMGMNIKKQYLSLRDKPILAHTIAAFEQTESIDEIIVVVGKEEIDKVKEEIVKLYEFKKIKSIVAGGKERQDSVYNGLKAVSESVKYVMVHDGARPFIKEETIEQVLKLTIEKGAVIAAVPVKDTIKVVDQSSLEVKQTPKREELWAIQTPQSFERTILLEAYRIGNETGIQATDDSMLVEAAGYKVQVVMGDYTNIKITTPEDLILGETILAERFAKKI